MKRSWQGSFPAGVEEFDESDKKSQLETAGHSTSTSEAMYILRPSSLGSLDSRLACTVSQQAWALALHTSSCDCVLELQSIVCGSEE